MDLRRAALVAAFGVLVAGCSTGCSTAGDGSPATPTAPAAHADASRSASEAASPVATPTVAPPTVTPPAPAARAVAAPVATPCSTNTRRQWVLVSLTRQHLWLCARHRVVRDTAITSGMRGAYTETPTGSYAIQGLNRNTVLTLADGRTYAVKYWIPFDAPLFGFHDSPWQHFAYGSARYATAGSHGCVHVPLAALRFLFHWARIGTPVRIRA